MLRQGLEVRLDIFPLWPGHFRQRIDVLFRNIAEGEVYPPGPKAFNRRADELSEPVLHPLDPVEGLTLPLVPPENLEG